MSSGPSDADDVIAPPRPRHALAFRLSVWYAAVFVASLAALVAFAVPIVRAAMHGEETAVLEGQVERHIAVLATTGLPAYQAAIEQADRLGPPTLAVRVRDPAGRTLYQHGDVTTTLRTERMTGQLRLEASVADGRWQAVIDRLRPAALALAAGALLLAVVGGYLLTRRALRPVRELAATTREVVRSGDLSRRVAERGTGDELDELSALFNRMLARNQRLVRGMREALDNVAHDLRTPLTRVRGTAEVALRGDDPAATREALADCIEDADDALRMLATVMDLSEAETGIMRLDRQPTDLTDLAHEVADLYAHVADDAGVSLTIDGDADVTANADPTRLRQVIANLVDNAIKYTPRGGHVTVETTREDHQAILRVHDTGTGIAADSIPRIWDRLYRADPSRSQRGLGLGLSVVRAIVHAHGGRVSVESQSGAGSTFTMSIPLHGAPPSRMAR